MTARSNLAWPRHTVYITRLDPAKRKEVDNYVLRGWPATAVAMATFVALKTARESRARLVADNHREIFCACGKLSNHLGICPTRRAIAAEAYKIRQGALPALPPPPPPPAPKPRLRPLHRPLKAFLPPIETPGLLTVARLKSSCPGGFCPMLIEFAELVGDYIIEYWVCGCNEERTRRVVV